MPKYSALVASDPAPESKEVLANIDKKGIGGIFTFPFSLKAKAEIQALQGANEDFEYRIYSPFVVNDGQPRLHPDVPVEKWPKFKFAPEVPEVETKKVPATTQLIADGDHGTRLIAYDGMRIDVLGPIDRVESELLRFSKSFLDWLRCYSGQPWINAFEYHFESKLKHQFAIDQNGLCIENPSARVEFIQADFSGITDEKFYLAAEKAIDNLDIPQYFTVFFDAQNSFARDNYWECALYLCLSIDMARHTLFVTKFPYTTRNNTIDYDNKALGDTDLLKVLSRKLDAQCGRNLENEQQAVWVSFKDLFLTRHQIAHGKSKANVNGQLVDISSDLVESWMKTAIDVIMFIEDVCDASFKFQAQRRRN